MVLKREVGKLANRSFKYYSWILFDLDNTLFDHNKSEELALRLVLEKHNIQLSADFLRLSRNIDRLLWIELEQETISVAELVSRRFEEFCIHITFSDPPEILRDDYLEILSKTYHLMPMAIETLYEISKTIQIAIITNGLKSQVDRVRHSPLSRYVFDILTSEDLGVCKPSRAFFEQTLERIKAGNKNEVLIVGDSLGSDILGGLNAGIDTCWLNLHSLKTETSIIPTYEIRKLEELFQILGIDKMNYIRDARS